MDKELIKKEDAVLRFTAEFCGHGTILSCEAQQKIKQMLDNVPAADAEMVRHRHWKLEVESFGPGYDGECYEEAYLVCSECGRKEYIDFSVMFAKEGELEAKAAEFPYCHCGAKMDGGVEYDSD